MSRVVSWVGDSLKAFGKFPEAVQRQIAYALDLAAQGQTPETVRPLKGLGAGIFEVRVGYRTDAYRAVYAVKLGADIYVLHAFQKKAKAGIKTPKKDIDLIRERIKRMKEKER